MTALFSRVLEAPFPSKRMVFPFPAPAQWRLPKILHPTDKE